MTRYLNTTPDIQARIAKDLREKTISASELLGRAVSYHEAVQAFRTGFERAWHLPLVPLSEAELLQLLGQSNTVAVH
jgi:lipoate-protein ligase A